MAIKTKKLILNRDIKTIKNFTYTIDGVNLAFALSVDDTVELTKFRHLLAQAQTDIDELLEEAK